MKHPLTREAVRDLFGLDEVALNRLSTYLDLLAKWQRRINLVGSSTLRDPWRRHILDCGQLARHLPCGHPLVVDLGSGAGFPGLVLAIVSEARVVLVESDARKCAFLREAARITGTSVEIRPQRIETLPSLAADVATARACAPLAQLLAFAYSLLAPSGLGLFLKGRGVEAELTEARKTWKMRATRIPSLSDPSGVVLKLEDVSPRDER